MTSSITPAPITTPSNDKNSIDVKYGYADSEIASTKKKSVYGVRVSSLQDTLRKSVARMNNLDNKNKNKNNKNNGDDGERNEEEEIVVQAVNNLVSTAKINRMLKIIIVVSVCVTAIALVGCVFGATIAIARLSKQTEIDSITGIMYSKESNSDHSHLTTMKTEDVVIYSDMTDTSILDMTNEKLKTLKEILLPNGDVKFQVKGYARSKDNTQIGLLVQGGTIIYDKEGLASATGDAKILLDLAYYGSVQEVNPQESEDNVFGHRRYLATGCSGGQSGSGSGGSNENRGSF